MKPNKSSPSPPKKRKEPPPPRRPPDSWLISSLAKGSTIKESACAVLKMKEKRHRKKLLRMSLNLGLAVSPRPPPRAVSPLPVPLSRVVRARACPAAREVCGRRRAKWCCVCLSVAAAPCHGYILDPRAAAAPPGQGVHLTSHLDPLWPRGLVRWTSPTGSALAGMYLVDLVFLEGAGGPGQASPISQPH